MVIWRVTMNCQEFNKQSEQIENNAVSAEMSEHAETCGACRAILQAQTTLEQSLAALGKATPKVNLAPRIMTAIGKEHAPGNAPDSPLERFFQLFFPDNLMKKSLAVAISLLMLFIVGRETVFAPSTPDRASKWEMTLLSFDPAKVSPEWAGKKSGIQLPGGVKAFLGQGSKVNLRLPGRAEAEVENGELIPNSAGFFLSAGKATVHVEKTSSVTPFTIGTPFAEVAVIGTRFIVELTPAGLRVAVTEGRVRVIHPKWLRELKPGEFLDVSSGDFLPVAGIPKVFSSSASQASGAALVEPGSTSSLNEEENPGK